MQIGILRRFATVASLRADTGDQSDYAPLASIGLRAQPDCFGNSSLVEGNEIWIAQDRV